MKIITLSAKAEHGKDFTATLLKEKLESLGKKVLIIRYADYLKFIAHTYFLNDEQRSNLKSMWDKNEITRTVWQKLGTEKVRTKNPNFWVQIVSMFIKVFENDYDYFLIPDTRFPNEVQYLKEQGFKTIALYIERLYFENKLTQEQRLHPSETALNNYKFDYYIKVATGIENVQNEVNKFVTYLNGGINEKV